MSYTIKVASFEGPLELLLNLIEERKFSINTVALAEVTQGYFEYLTYLEKEVREDKTTYEQLSAFLVVASTLVLIKSKSLLPGFQLSGEEEEGIADLTARLEIYKQIRDVAGHIEQRLYKRTPLFTREPFEGVHVQFLPPDVFSVDMLPQIMKNLLVSIPFKALIPKKQIKEVISIEKKIKELENRIREGLVKSFSEFVGHSTKRTDIIVSFLALLELIRLGIIVVEQRNHFSDIMLRKSD